MQVKEDQANKGKRHWTLTHLCNVTFILINEGKGNTFFNDQLQLWKWDTAEARTHILQMEFKDQLYYLQNYEFKFQLK